MYIIDDVIIDTNVQVSGNKIESLAITPMYNCSAIKQCSLHKEEDPKTNEGYKKKLHKLTSFITDVTSCKNSSQCIVTD